MGNSRYPKQEQESESLGRSTTTTTTTTIVQLPEFVIFYLR